MRIGFKKAEATRAKIGGHFGWAREDLVLDAIPTAWVKSARLRFDLIAVEEDFGTCVIEQERRQIGIVAQYHSRRDNYLSVCCACHPENR